MENNIMGAVAFLAVLNSVKTMVDGGIRITFDIPDGDSETVKKLLDSRQKNLHVAIIPEPN